MFVRFLTAVCLVVCIAQVGRTDTSARIDSLTVIMPQAVALETAEVIVVPSPLIDFSSLEFSLFSNADDLAPDAHARRAKLYHAVIQAAVLPTTNGTRRFVVKPDLPPGAYLAQVRLLDNTGAALATAATRFDCLPRISISIKTESAAITPPAAIPLKVTVTSHVPEAVTGKLQLHLNNQQDGSPATALHTRGMSLPAAEQHEPSKLPLSEIIAEISLMIESGQPGEYIVGASFISEQVDTTDIVTQPLSLRVRGTGLSRHSGALTADGHIVAAWRAEEAVNPAAPGADLVVTGPKAGALAPGAEQLHALAGNLHRHGVHVVVTSASLNGAFAAAGLGSHPAYSVSPRVSADGLRHGHCFNSPDGRQLIDAEVAALATAYPNANTLFQSEILSGALDHCYCRHCTGMFRTQLQREYQQTKQGDESAIAAFARATGVAAQTWGEIDAPRHNDGSLLWMKWVDFQRATEAGYVAAVGDAWRRHKPAGIHVLAGIGAGGAVDLLTTTTVDAIAVKDTTPALDLAWLKSQQNAQAAKTLWLELDTQKHRNDALRRLIDAVGAGASGVIFSGEMSPENPAIAAFSTLRSHSPIIFDSNVATDATVHVPVGQSLYGRGGIEGSAALYSVLAAHHINANFTFGTSGASFPSSHVFISDPQTITSGFFRRIDNHVNSGGFLYIEGRFRSYDNAGAVEPQRIARSLGARPVDLGLSGEWEFRSYVGGGDDELERQLSTPLQLPGPYPLPQGQAELRRRFTAEPDLAGRRVALRLISGASHETYLNGSRLVFDPETGLADAGHLLRFDGENLLRVVIADAGFSGAELVLRGDLHIRTQEFSAVLPDVAATGYLADAAGLVIGRIDGLPVMVRGWPGQGEVIYSSVNLASMAGTQPQAMNFFGSIMPSYGRSISITRLGGGLPPADIRSHLRTTDFGRFIFLTNHGQETCGIRIEVPFEGITATNLLDGRRLPIASKDGTTATAIDLPPNGAAVISILSDATPPDALRVAREINISVEQEPPAVASQE